jgi:hypothetical protein
LLARVEERAVEVDGYKTDRKGLHWIRIAATQECR